MSAASGPDIIEDGLVLCLDAGNRESYPGSGTTWTSLIGGLNGTLTNGPTFNSANGGSIVFDGADDFVNTNFTQNLGNEFSVGVWCRPTANGQSAGSDIVVKNYSSSAPFASWGIEFMSDRRFRFGVANGSLFSPIQSSPFSLNQIYYVLSTYKNKLISGFVNASIVIQGTNTNDPIYDNNKTVTIGAWTESPNNNRFIGNVYNCHIYNRALTPAEVLQNYNATKSRFRV